MVQCGYCQPGQTLAATALLTTDPAPDDAAIGSWMNGNGPYPRMLDTGYAAWVSSVRMWSATAQPQRRREHRSMTVAR